MDSDNAEIREAVEAVLNGFLLAAGVLKLELGFDLGNSPWKSQSL